MQGLLVYYFVVYELCYIRDVNVCVSGRKVLKTRFGLDVLGTGSNQRKLAGAGTQNRSGQGTV